MPPPLRDPGAGDEGTGGLAPRSLPVQVGIRQCPASPVACQVAMQWLMPLSPLQAGKVSGMECSPDTRQGEQSAQDGCGAWSKATARHSLLVLLP